MAVNPLGRLGRRWPPQSLYRRYRPRRFAEIKGQDHVVKALRDSVASGREGQAYLFSGPRGTGKTTSARILAKVLNCERPVDGEPCCECSSCGEVERGVSYDVHELDAASNNGVEAMRDLIEKAQLGTPGRHKVYILDEVHMLSKQSEAALLKTLEEPPSHVVFVLATTEPQKVSDTIRSRTQHLRFHLLAPDTLAEHVRWVAADAGLDIGDDAVAAAVSQGAGSARDTLSALELIASSGGDVGEVLTFDEFVEALIEHDPGQALTAMAQPRQRRPRRQDDRRAARQAPARRLPRADGSRPRAAARRPGRRAGRAGPAARRASARRRDRAPRHDHDRAAPCPRSPRARRGRAGAAHTAAGCCATTMPPGWPPRVAKLEKAAAAAPATATSRPRSIPPPDGPSSAGAAQRSAPAAGGAGERDRPGRAATTSGGGTAEGPAPAPAAAGAPPDAASTEAEWLETVRPTLRGLARALFAPVEFVGGTADTVTLSAPNPTHRGKCPSTSPTSRRRGATSPGASSASPGATTVRRRIAGATSGPPRRGPRRSTRPDELDAPDESRPAIAGGPSVLERLAEAFPGAERVEGDG